MTILGYRTTSDYVTCPDCAYADEIACNITAVDVVEYYEAYNIPLRCDRCERALDPKN